MWLVIITYGAGLNDCRVRRYQNREDALAYARTCKAIDPHDTIEIAEINDRLEVSK